MRPLLLLICLFALGVAVAGCGGGSDKSAQTLPPPPALTVPGGETAPATPDTVPTTPTTTEPSSGGVAGGTGTSSGGTGGSSSGGTGSSQTQSTTPSGGTAPGKFNQFCQENPGAC